MVKKLLFFSLFLVWNFSLIAQDKNSALYRLGPFNNLDFSGDIPEQILSTRSVVIVSFPQQLQKRTKYKTWKEFASAAHEIFEEVGVDAIAYYNVLDLTSGPETTRSFAADFLNRQFKTLIFLEVFEGQGNINYNLFITPINEDGTMIKENQHVFFSTSEDYNFIIRDFRKNILLSDLKKQNNLINLVPEFFSQTRIIKNRRMETYAPDLKVDKLAVPVFRNFDLPESFVSSEAALTKHDIIKNETSKIMTSYPLKYEIVELEKGEESLKRLGCHYVLYYINSSARSIREILLYNDKTDASLLKVKVREGDKVVDKNINLDEQVYKFYLKQIFSGDIYVGSQWDAADTWENALSNFIFNLKKELKVE
jgi:hypothetical protein